MQSVTETTQEKDYEKLLTKFLKGQSADRRDISVQIFSHITEILHY